MLNVKKEYFCGIDIGTQGVRSVICDRNGDVIASASEAFSILNINGEQGCYEQWADEWWEATKKVLQKCVHQYLNTSAKIEEIVAISIDGTSATIVPLDNHYKPLANALMYNDMRSSSQATKIHTIGNAFEEKMGLRFNASFALPKILWFKDNKPLLYGATKVFAHQADYIVGKLCGEYAITDYSNALKTGYDLIDDKWPELIDNLGIDTGKLPKVIAPGKFIGNITTEVFNELGLSTSTVVVAGATDGYTSALAAGAVKPGEWASIIGTTLVLKGVTSDLIIDPTGSSYSHKLPSGAWMLGGAANIGGRFLNSEYDKSDFHKYDETVEKVVPTGVISYPLCGKGERFPFVDPNAEAFFVGDISDKEIYYAAIMEGVAYAERLAFELMMRCGCTVGNIIYTTGGACKSEQWLKIRASVLNRRLMVPKIVDAAMGCAMLAASNTYYNSLEQAAEHMISFEKVIDPDPKLVPQYEKLYQQAFNEYTKRFSLGGNL